MAKGLTAKLEFELSGRGNGWTDVSNDLAGDLRLRYGINGSGPADRVASTGVLNFALDNSSKNSAGLLGYYSPNHANRRPGFKLGIGVRLGLVLEGDPVIITSSSVANPTVITTAAAHGYTTGDTVVISGHSGSTPSLDGTHTVTVLNATQFTIPVNVTVGGAGGTVTRKNTWYKFNGTLDHVQPVAGLFEDLVTHCVAVDWMNEAARVKVTGLATQVNKRSDELFELLLGVVLTPPASVEIQTGQDTYAYAFDNTRDEATAVLTEFQRLAASELGYIYIKGDRTTGGTLVFESRRHRATAIANVATFSDVNRLSLLEAAQGRETVINKMQVVTHQRRVDSVNTTVLYKITGPIQIAAGQSFTLLGPYHDPAQEAERVGGTDMINPVAGTDYQVFANQDGTGADLTANFSVSATFGGNGVRFTITNTGSQTGWLTKLQCRGRGIYDYLNVVLEAEDSLSQINYGEHVATLDMPYQSNAGVGSEAALYLVNLYKDPSTQVQTAGFFAPYSDEKMIDELLRREISDRIGITEQVTGITSTTGYFINAVDLALDDRNNLSVSWLLAPADKTAYWLLEVQGRSELDQSTVLGFGQIIGHTDVAHCDTHGDVAHVDVAHSDVTHSDAAHLDHDDAHQDTAHTDTHGDVAHTDVAHSDAAHLDSHSDVAHLDSHSDVAHSDVAHSDVAHSDVAHSDVAHDDVAHQDSHNDVPHDDWFSDVDHGDTRHVDVHLDEAHSDVAHSDVAHSDVAHSDLHTDTHSDVAHSDSHNDAAHSDVAHSDVAHSDSHGDVAHSDVAGGHQDAAHGDVAHADVNHSDVAHADDHCDTAHGDI